MIGCKGGALGNIGLTGTQADARITTHIPADEVPITTVVRIAEGAVYGMASHHIEEAATTGSKAIEVVILHGQEYGVLLISVELMKCLVAGLVCVVVNGAETDHVVVTGSGIMGGQ